MLLWRKDQRCDFHPGDWGLCPSKPEIDVCISRLGACYVFRLEKIFFGGIWFVRCLLGPLKYNIHHILKRIYGRNEMVSSLLFLQILLK